MSHRCYEGQLMRDDPPTWDDPIGSETDMGQCPECNGIGCDELPAIEAQAERAAAIGSCRSLVPFP